jgi:large subunit ribosomal protein L7e
MADRVVPPKPEGLRKKEERDAKVAGALKQLREQRRTDNKQRREQVLLRAQQQEAAYQAANQAEITARRQAKLTGQIHVPAQPRLAFVVRIRGINKLNPKVLRILRLLRLRQIHNGVFVRVNKASSNLLRRVEPYITFGYPSRESIRKLVLKRGYGKVNKQRIPLSDNQVVAESLGKQGIESVEDLINEIQTVGPHFKEANNFIWPFKLRGPRGGFAAKRHPFQRRGDWGNREEYINQLIAQML